MHRAIAERLVREPEIVDAARARVERWLRSGSVNVEYAVAWQTVLRGSTEAIVSVLTDRGERACALRQVSPFAGALDARERWRIRRRVREQLG